MAVYVVKSDAKYDWEVRIGAASGRGSVIKSRHRLKRQALDKGKKLAKKRSETLKEQMNAGYWRTVGKYG